MNTTKDVLPSLLVVWGVTLLCLAILDFVGYESFLLSFAWR
jgi:hypothetical protein